MYELAYIMYILTASAILTSNEALLVNLFCERKFQTWTVFKKTVNQTDHDQNSYNEILSWQSKNV